MLRSTTRQVPTAIVSARAFVPIVLLVHREKLGSYLTPSSRSCSRSKKTKLHEMPFEYHERQ